LITYRFYFAGVHEQSSITQAAVTEA